MSFDKQYIRRATFTLRVNANEKRDENNKRPDLFDYFDI